MKSVKKTLGSLGCVVFFTLCIIGALKEPKCVESLLWPLMGLIAALFGIKTFGGVLSKKEDNKRGGEP